MKKIESSPAEFVRAPLSDERLEDLWSNVQRAESKAKSRALGVRGALAALAVLGAVLAALLVVGSLNEPQTVGAVASSGERSAPLVPAAPDRRDAQELSLPDGSRLSLVGETRARVVTLSAGEVRVRLDSGKVECEVAPDPRRRFIVEAGAFQVVVTGTRFAVSAGAGDATPAGVSVRVERGSVEVREPSQRVLAVLGAGQRWASDGRAEMSAARDRDTAPPGASPAPAAARAPSAGRTAPVTEDAKALFTRASEARLAGHPREAAGAFEELWRRYPDDERAGYSAFMSGRLRLDALGDAQGAVQALSFALAHPGGNPFFAEDAGARLVEALAKSGAREACGRARTEFLAKHPTSAHAAIVAKQCEGPR